MRTLIAGMVLIGMMAAAAAAQTQPQRVTIPVPKVNGPIATTAESHGLSEARSLSRE